VVRIVSECIVGGGATAVVAGSVPTALILAAANSKARRPNRHKMKAAAATSRASRTRPRLLFSSDYAPGDGANAGSSAGTNRRFSRRAGIAR